MTRSQEYRRKDYAARFWARVARSDHCWLWTGATYASGYGAFWANRKMRRAHRVAYELTHGPVAEGHVLLHSCDTPLCCNPGHLRPGTQKENLDDMRAKGRGRGQP